MRGRPPARRLLAFLGVDQQHLKLLLGFGLRTGRRRQAGDVAPQALAELALVDQGDHHRQERGGDERDQAHHCDHGPDRAGEQQRHAEHHDPEREHQAGKQPEAGFLHQRLVVRFVSHGISFRLQQHRRRLDPGHPGGALAVVGSRHQRCP